MAGRRARRKGVDFVVRALAFERIGFGEVVVAAAASAVDAALHSAIDVMAHDPGHRAPGLVRIVRGGQALGADAGERFLADLRVRREQVAQMAHALVDLLVVDRARRARAAADRAAAHRGITASSAGEMLASNSS